MSEQEKRGRGRPVTTKKEEIQPAVIDEKELTGEAIDVIINKETGNFELIKIKYNLTTHKFKEIGREPLCDWKSVHMAIMKAKAVIVQRITSIKLDDMLKKKENN